MTLFQVLGGGLVQSTPCFPQFLYDCFIFNGIYDSLYLVICRLDAVLSSSPIQQNIFAQVENALWFF